MEQQLDSSSFVTSETDPKALTGTSQSMTLPDYPKDAVWMDAYLDARGRLQSVLDLYITTPAVHVLPQIEGADGFPTAIARAQEAFPGLPTRFTDDEALPAICRNVRDLLKEIADQCEREHLAPIITRIQSGQLFLAAIQQAHTTAQHLSLLLGEQPVQVFISADDLSSREEGSRQKRGTLIGRYQVLAIALVNVALALVALDHTWASLAAALALLACGILFARHRPEATLLPPDMLAVLDQRPFVTTLLQLVLAVALPLGLGVILHVLLIPIVSVPTISELFRVPWKSMLFSVHHLLSKRPRKDLVHE